MIRSLCLVALFAVPTLAVAQQPAPVVQKAQKAIVKVNEYRVVGTNGKPSCWVKILNTTTGRFDIIPVVNGHLPVTYYREGVTVYDYSRPYPYSGGNEEVEVAVQVPFNDKTPNGIKKPEAPKNDGARPTPNIPDTPQIKPVVQPETAPTPRQVKPLMPKTVDAPKRDK